MTAVRLNDWTSEATYVRPGGASDDHARVVEAVYSLQAFGVH